MSLPGTPFPLSEEQKGLWYIQQGAPETSAYNVVFTARSEGFIRNRPDLSETIRRLKAYAAATWGTGRLVLAMAGRRIWVITPRGEVDAGERVILFNTGSGVKYMESFTASR